MPTCAAVVLTLGNDRHMSSGLAGGSFAGPQRAHNIGQFATSAFSCKHVFMQASGSLLPGHGFVLENVDLKMKSSSTSFGPGYIESGWDLHGRRAGAGQNPGEAQKK